ncbi:MAG: hypothetical protein QW680_10380 [Pyrobaculum sp.]
MSHRAAGGKADARGRIAVVSEGVGVSCDSCITYVTRGGYVEVDGSLVPVGRFLDLVDADCVALVGRGAVDLSPYLGLLAIYDAVSIYKPGLISTLFKLLYGRAGVLGVAYLLKTDIARGAKPDAQSIYELGSAAFLMAERYLEIPHREAKLHLRHILRLPGIYMVMFSIFMLAAGVLTTVWAVLRFLLHGIAHVVLGPVSLLVFLTGVVLYALFKVYISATRLRSQSKCMLETGRLIIDTGQQANIWDRAIGVMSIIILAALLLHLGGFTSIAKEVAFLVSLLIIVLMGICLFKCK